MAKRSQYVLPFSALVGQKRLKLGLILNTINPAIGGLLIRGPKGTGKTTAVYAMANLLPEREVIADCPYNCSLEETESLCSTCRERHQKKEEIPLAQRKIGVIPLPLSISEDRLIGSIDMEKLLAEGQKAFQPGLLATANRNFLYVDEINLLPDHITDDILDAAASGWNTVEREGFSITHPARFILVGTMNPEEGELRPQLLDRLPLSVSLGTITDEQQRVEIIKRNLAFSHNPESVLQDFSAEDDRIRTDILSARKRLHRIRVPEYQLRAVAATCIDLKIDGQRPEIVITRTAMTIASYHDRSSVENEDLLEACELSLSHRTRDGGFEPPATPEEIASALEKALAKHQGKDDGSHLFGFPDTSSPEKKKIDNLETQADPESQTEPDPSEPLLSATGTVHNISTKPAIKSSLPLVSVRQAMQALKGALARLKVRFSIKSKRQIQQDVGKRASSFTSESRGRPVRYQVPSELPRENLAFQPSVLAAITRQGARLPVKLLREDLREWVKEGKAPLTLVLIVDSSASTFHFIEPTARILSVLYRDAYLNRDKLGLVAIQDGTPRIINHPSRNLRVVLGNLTRLKPSGLTPLSEALELALTLFKQERRRQSVFHPVAVLLSDGHPEPVEPESENLMEERPYKEAIKNARLFGRARIPIIVINPAHGAFKDRKKWWGTQLGMRIAALSGGKYYGIPHDRYLKRKGLIQRQFEKRYLRHDSKAIIQILHDFRTGPVEGYQS